MPKQEGEMWPRGWSMHPARAWRKRRESFARSPWTLPWKPAGGSCFSSFIFAWASFRLPSKCSGSVSAGKWGAGRVRECVKGSFRWFWLGSYIYMETPSPPTPPQDKHQEIKLLLSAGWPQGRRNRSIPVWPQVLCSKEMLDWKLVKNTWTFLFFSGFKPTSQTLLACCNCWHWIAVWLSGQAASPRMKQRLIQTSRECTLDLLLRDGCLGPSYPGVLFQWLISSRVVLFLLIIHLLRSFFSQTVGGQT